MLISSVFRLSKAVLFSAVTAVALLAQAHAMSVGPISAELSASGQNSKMTLRVTNDGAQPIPVEIIPSRLTLAEDGTATTAPVKNKFLIFPPQATIAPGASQSFRVQWLGGADLKASETYILGANQLPIAMDKKKSGVQVVFNFSTVVTVSPANAKPNISVLKAEIGKAPQISRAPTITVQNTGNGHALLGDAVIALTDGKWTKTLSRDEVRAIFGLGLVQPKSKRRFVVAMPLPAEVSHYQVQIELQDKKSAR